MIFGRFDERVHAVHDKSQPVERHEGPRERSGRAASVARREWLIFDL